MLLFLVSASAQALLRMFMRINSKTAQKEGEYGYKVCNAMRKTLGTDCRVECKEVRKNNGVILHGLLVLGENRNVAPTIYLDTFLEAYEAGATFGSIIQRLEDICREDMLRESVDIEFFRSFERLIVSICFCVIGRKGF